MLYYFLTYHILWDDEILCIYYNEKLLGKLKSKMFTHLLFRCYLDEKSVCRNFKNNILSNSLNIL